MPFIEWTKDFSVHEELMDKQHQLLFDYINEFCDAIDEEVSREVLVASFQKIVAYTNFHFKDEEKMLKECNYPDYAVHKMIHESLLSEVMVFKGKIENGEPNVENEVKQFLKLWLSAHIKGIDTKYSKFV